MTKKKKKNFNREIIWLGDYLTYPPDLPTRPAYLTLQVGQFRNSCDVYYKNTHPFFSVQSPASQCELVYIVEQPEA